MAKLFKKLFIGNIVKNVGNRVFKKLALQLSAPTITLEGDTLSITDNNGKAEEFEILVDGEVKATVSVESEEPPTPTVTFDLSTLNLSVGIYTITVRAKASGHETSEPSNEISYNILGILLAPSTQYMYDEGKIRIYNDNDGLICNLYYHIQAQTQTLSDVKTQSSVVKNNKLICDDVSISNLVKAELS